MATERRPNKRNHSGFVLNNQMLLLLVGVLSVILVVLLIVGGSLLNNNTTDPGNDMLNSSGSVGSSSSGASGSGVINPSSSAVTNPSSSAVTQPSNSVTTQPSSTAPVAPPPVTPSGGNYIDVGSGYIAEVIQANVETFDGGTYDDYSHPTNNYLPEGTVDYCKKELVYGSGMKYVQLRSGHRVYYDKKVYPFPGGIAKMIPEVKQYDGYLPDHNEIGVVSLETVDRHSVLTLDSLWKAPFYFETNQSGYAKPNGGKDRDYAVVSNNATYVDITFCYTTVFTGEVTIPADHILFKSAQIIKNESDYTLRLFLRKTGGFYGWYAYYNDNDQLCFRFLNPAKVSAADNKYGADLTGTTIMIDVGHGGDDPGATAYYCATCQKYPMAPELKKGKCPDCGEKPELFLEESTANMTLALAMKAELESVGATVVFNRTEDVILNVNDRQANLHEIAPDVCIAIHQNSNNSKSVRGFFSYYYTPWSQSLAKNIYQHTKDSGMYTRNFLQWKANYFMNRQSDCPIMLTENGFMSNAEDLAAMVEPTAVQNKAIAIVQGIADYFLDINK